MGRRLAINKASLRKYSNLDVAGYGEMVDNLNNVLDKTGAENLKGVFMAAGRVLQAKVRANAEPHIKSGRLSANIFVAEGKPDKANVMVGIAHAKAPEGVWLEYGTSRQPARPFFRPAVTASKPEMARIITDGMKKTIEDAVKQWRLGRQ